MPYALFANNTKLSRALPTEMEVWRYAEDSGLVIAGVHGEERLDDNYAIKPCPRDVQEAASPSLDVFGINKLT